MKRLIWIIDYYLLYMEAPPLDLKNLQTPPGDSFAYYYRPPLADG